ncbi:MAG: hypothetical protein NC938_03885 [Candidatus Omnitrophica bacterium]|nr:hypothetical protein [Candidatus Omnitrophota bacterium]MCM8790822.1 hypothetical protein [Candidatus Omnitrophota bacterium]
MNIKPNLQFSVLCDDVRREDNGKFILIGLFEAINARKFPATHPTLFVVNRWCKGEGQFSQRIRIVSSIDRSIAFQTDEQRFELKDIDGHHTLISKVNNITFRSAGKYWVEILLDGDLVLNYPIMLKEEPGFAKDGGREKEGQR